MNEEQKYVPTKRACELLQVTAATLRNWDKAGKIDVIRTPSNIRLYNLEDIQDIIGWDPPSIQKKKIVYCRVSSSKQLEDLERQKQLLTSLYPHHELVTDIASGLNWKRKGFKTILELAMQGELEQVVVAHRDRLCRFAFELVEFIFEKNKVSLVVQDREEHKSSDAELTEDILSIVHVYSCRQMGKRRYKSKKNQNISQSGTEIET